MQTIYHTLNNNSGTVAKSPCLHQGCGHPWAPPNSATEPLRRHRPSSVPAVNAILTMSHTHSTHTHRERERGTDNAEWHSIKHISTPINGQKGSQRETDNDNDNDSDERTKMKNEFRKKTGGKNRRKKETLKGSRKKGTILHFILLPHYKMEFPAHWAIKQQPKQKVP